MERAKRFIVKALARADEVVDEVLYRPAIVKAFLWVPRWWNCDLAKLSLRLNDRWQTRAWTDAFGVPGEPCEACGRRASWVVYGGPPDPEFDGDEGDDDDLRYLDDRPIVTCGWCHLLGPMSSEAEVQATLRAAREDSIAWRWRWRVRDR